MNLFDYLIITIYLCALLGMGFFLKNQQSRQEYFLGGRSIGWKPLSLSIMATQLSAVSFVSAPAFVGLREGGGLIWLSYELALPLAMLLLLLWVLPFLHQAKVLSVYDYLEQRFSRASRVLISLVFQISRSFATAIMIYAIAIILQGALGLAFWQSIIFIGLITLIYSLQGGMKAVVYGDALQMILIILGTLICLGFALYHIGGVNVFLDNLEANRIEAVRFDSYGFNGDSFGFWPMLLGGIVLYASYYGCDQSEAQRSLSAKNSRDLSKMIMAASFLRFPITVLYCLTGLVVGTLAIMTPSFLEQIPTSNPDWMMPLFIVNYLPNGIIGLIVVAILAAAMSSLSSAINSLSAVTLEDYCRYTNKQLSNKQYLVYARLVSVFWGIATLFLSMHVDSIAPTIIEAINKIGSLFYGPILACFLLGIMTKRVQSLHINIALVSGLLLNIYLWQFAQHIFWFWWNLFGFSCTVLVALLTSYVFKQHHQTELSDAVQATTQDVIHLHESEKLKPSDTKTKAFKTHEKLALIAWFIVILTILIVLTQLPF